MRAARPIPGNPWPHDMVLRITEDDDALLQLLWVRAAWQLQPDGDDPGTPELLPSIPVSPQQLRRRKDGWEHSWTELWDAALEHLARPQNPNLHQQISATPPGSPERLALLTDARGPHWADRVGPDAFGDTYRSWTTALHQRAQQEFRLPLGQQPERRDLNALIPAWQRGLTTIITIPCTGNYLRTVGEHTLVLTHSARADPDRYPSALHRFPDAS